MSVLCACVCVQWQLILASGKPWLSGIAPDYTHFQQPQSNALPVSSPPPHPTMAPAYAAVITARERRSMLRELPQLFALAPSATSAAKSVPAGSDCTDGDPSASPSTRARSGYSLRSTQPLAPSSNRLRSDAAVKPNPFVGSRSPVRQLSSNSNAHSTFVYVSSQSTGGYEDSSSASTEKEVTNALLDYRIGAAVGSELVAAMHNTYAVQCSVDYSTIITLCSLLRVLEIRSTGRCTSIYS